MTTINKIDEADESDIRTLDGIDSVIYSSVCNRCKRFTGTQPGDRSCEAFPDGTIPDEIWLGRNDHTEPYEGDGGKQFIQDPRILPTQDEIERGRFAGSLSVFRDADDDDEDARPADDDLRKAARVYLKPGESAPSGVQVKTGPRGGKYYDATPGTDPDRFEKLPGRPSQPKPSDELTGAGYIDPVKDSPYEVGSDEYSKWRRENESRFVRNPWDKDDDIVLWRKWQYTYKDRAEHSRELHRWETYSAIEDQIEDIGVPAGHEWALKRYDFKGKSGIPLEKEDEHIEVDTFGEMSKSDRAAMKERGEPVPYRYDPTISKDEFFAIEFYTGYGYEWIKAWLRPWEVIGGPDPEGVYSTLWHVKDMLENHTANQRDLVERAEKVKSAIEHMSAVMERDRVPITHDIFRGVMSLDEVSGPVDPADLDVGDYLHDHSFTSWSSDPWTAHRFTRRELELRFAARSEHPTVIRIKNPHGIPGIYVGGYEQETILPAGMKYRVVAVDEVGVHPRAGKRTDPHLHPDDYEVRWSVITVEPVLDDVVEKGERIYVTRKHPAPTGVKIYRGKRGGVFYFGEGRGKWSGMIGPTQRRPAPERDNSGAGGSVEPPTERFARRSEDEGIESEFRSVDELRSVLSGTKYALISAGRNPKREPDEPEETFIRRHEQLRSDLAASGYVYTQVLGSYGDFEDSFLVMIHDSDLRPMLELGSRYNQDSIIWADHGTNYMVYTTDSVDDDGNAIAAGSYLKGEGYEEISHEAGDFFTEVYLSEGAGDRRTARFSLNFDWDTLHQPDTLPA